MFLIFTAVVIITAANGEDRVSLRKAARMLGASQVENYVPADVLDGFALPTKNEWQSFWAGVQKVLRSGNLEEMAWIRPEAERILKVLDNVKGGQLYGDWLRQRIDYLEVAEFVIKKFPSVRPDVKAEITPPPQDRIVRSYATPPLVVSPAPIFRERTETVSSVDLWKEKLRGRPPPARASKLVPGLKKIFQDEGVPPALVWQAEVESSFNPGALSPAGARGLYQFMPATGRSFGLSEGPPDDRLNPGKSARAAACYLKKLYHQFHSWPLVLAAYNAGEGRVGRTLKQYRGRTFSDVAPYLPAETQMYVPKVLATIYHREGIEPENIPSPTGI